MSYSAGLQPYQQNVPLLIAGVPLSLFGSKSKDVSPTLANITNISASVNTVTISVDLTAGNIPTTSQLLTVQNASNSAINAVSAAITSVSGFNSGDNSIGTISYTVTGVGTIASVAGSGQVVMPTAVTPDVCQTGNSIYAALPYNDPRIDQARTLVFQALFPSIPTTASLDAYVSDDGVNFYSIGNIASVTAGVVTGGFLSVIEQSPNFVQVRLSSVTGGTNPTVWCTVSA